MQAGYAACIESTGSRVTPMHLRCIFIAIELREFLEDYLFFAMDDETLHDGPYQFCWLIVTLNYRWF